MQKRNKIIIAVALLFALAMLLLYSRKTIAPIQGEVNSLPPNAPLMAFPDNPISPLQMTLNRQGYNPGENPVISFGAPSSRNNSSGACCNNCQSNVNGPAFTSGILNAALAANMSRNAVASQILAVGEMPNFGGNFGGAPGRAIF